MVYDNDFWIALSAVAAVIVSNNCITRLTKCQKIKKGRYNSHDKNYA